jgi:DNA-binding CsgD family transcriptional regulator
MRGLIGRDAELAVCERLLGEVPARPVALVVDGPIGIGKTALLTAAAELARERGYQVLSCQPTELETTLPYAAVADLLEPVVKLAGDLPKPQRQAIEIALLRHDEPDQVADERALCFATRGLLGRSSDPTVLVIDNVRWLDAPSVRVLRFALRRITDAPLVVIAARRPDDFDPRRTDGPAEALDVERILPADAVHRLTVGGMRTGALHHLLRDQLGLSLPRQLLASVATASDGNPLFTLELGRALSALPKLPAPSRELPVPSSLTGLIADRLAGLDATTTQALRLAALAAPASFDVLSEASEGSVAGALEGAEDAGLISLGGGQVRFTHPVYASVVRAGIPDTERRRLHQRLADVVTDVERRARHLAAASIEPDEELAATLEEAARLASRRGALDVAADLAEQATEATPRGNENAPRRILLAGQSRAASGDLGAAQQWLARHLDVLPLGHDRTEAYLLLATSSWHGDDYAAAAANAYEALDAAAADPIAEGKACAHLSLMAPEERQLEHGHRAIELLRGTDEREWLAFALFQTFYSEVVVGKQPDLAMFDEALALESADPGRQASTTTGIWYKAIDAYDKARVRYEEMLDRARDAGDEASALELLPHLGETEFLSGRWELTERRVDEALTLAGELDVTCVQAEFVGHLLAAYRGDVAAARDFATWAIRRGEEANDRWLHRVGLRLLGAAEVTAGDYAAAAVHLQEIQRQLEQAGQVEPVGMRHELDLTEALAGSGADDAELAALVKRLEERNDLIPRARLRLAATVGNGLIEGLRGSPGDGAALVESVLAELAEKGEPMPPFDRARAQLVAGRLHRRARAKAAARQALDAAIAGFEQLGATAWVERAQSERDRIGGRPPAPTELTATETQVAKAAAGGATTREIAETLFLSPKTVEANLTRIYRKLGIRSRAELGAMMSRGDPEGNP